MAMKVVPFLQLLSFALLMLLMLFLTAFAMRACQEYEPTPSPRLR